MLRNTRASHKPIDRDDFQRRMQFGTLQFELSNFKVGLLSEIANVNYSALVTKPAAADGDALFVAPGHFVYNKDGFETQSAIAKTRWATSQTLSENWEQPFGTVYPKMEWAGKHNRYASLAVHVAYAGKSRDYREMFLFGKDASGQEIISSIDTVIALN